jgi:hypothetical protein
MPTKEGLKHHPRENILEVPERSVLQLDSDEMQALVFGHL